MRLLLSVSILLCSFAHAKDLGQQGAMFSIKETCILEIMKKKLQGMNLEEEWRKKVKSDVERPTNGYTLPLVKKTNKRFVDPTFTVEKDIKTPEGTYIAKKGDSFNILAKMQATSPALFNSVSQYIFIDGDDKKQVKWLKEQGLTSKENIKILLINGSPQEVQQELKRPVWFDQYGSIGKAFYVEKVPSIVRIKEHTLEIQEAALDD